MARETAFTRTSCDATGGKETGETDGASQNCVGPVIMAPNRRNSKTHWVNKLGLVLGALGLALGGLETVLVFVVPPPIVWLYPQESYEYDENLRHRLKPNQQAFTHSAPVRTNSYGLRNAEFTLQPSPGVVRILCLGDSLTFGNGVQSSETYPKQLETMLNGRDGRRFEVINAGVPAYDTWQEVAYLREDGIRFAPHVVIIGFFGNDIVARPKTWPSVNAVPREGIGRRAMYWLKRSRIVTLLRERIPRLIHEVRPSGLIMYERAVLTGNATHSLEAGFREIDSSFREVANLADEHEFAALVVLFPMPNQLLHQSPNSLYPRRIIDMAARYGIPTLDLMPAFSREFRGLGSLFIEWDGHPNAKGYAIAAREISQVVLKMVGDGTGMGPS